jgi:hypothetical protein
LYTEGIPVERIRPGTPFVQVIQEQTVTCPYCGERIDILLDLSVPYQNYIEDCQVCCQPIVFDISVDEDGGVFVEAKSEND